MQPIEVLTNFNHGQWLRKISSLIDLQELEWKIQDQKKNAILFLKTSKNPETQKLLKTISAKTIGLVIVDNPEIIKDIASDIACYFCEENHWMELQYQLANIFYPIPDNVQFTAVTGTNGKTSTVYFLSQLLQQQGIQCLSLGTLGIFYDLVKVSDVALTSPSFLDFRKCVFKYAKKNNVVAFEMSSHALVQKRFYKIPLEVAAWTSFSQDHLDYHHNMENYFNAKKLILEHLKPEGKLFVPCEQNEIFHKLQTDVRVKKCLSWEKNTFNTNNPLFQASFAKDNFILAFEMTKVLLRKLSLDVDFTKIKNAAGRWMLKSFNQRQVIIDYAHTPDALINVCQNAKEAFPGAKLKVLFGCGGDRDKTKRPLMAKAVSSFADYIYITSDNPRTEDEEAIIDDIMPGISVRSYRNANREQTLLKALEELMAKEVLIVAGKGHEDYIIKGTIKHPYSDERVCDDFILKKEK